MVDMLDQEQFTHFLYNFNKLLVTLSHIANILRTQFDRVQFTEITINAHNDFVLSDAHYSWCRCQSASVGVHALTTSVSSPRFAPPASIIMNPTNLRNDITRRHATVNYHCYFYQQRWQGRLFKTRPVRLDASAAQDYWKLMRVASRRCYMHGVCNAITWNNVNVCLWPDDAAGPGMNPFCGPPRLHHCLRWLAEMQTIQQLQWNGSSDTLSNTAALF